MTWNRDPLTVGYTKKEWLALRGRPMPDLGQCTYLTMEQSMDAVTVRELRRLKQLQDAQDVAREVRATTTSATVRKRWPMK
jgi:hypothetical protein